MQLSKIFILLIFFQLVGCNQKSDEQKVFYLELGIEKTKAINSVTNSFHEFLKTNYPDEKSLAEKTRNYLEEVLTENRGWKYNYQLSTKALDLMERSGLRKDLYIYDSELSNYSGYNIRNFLTVENPTSNVDSSFIETDFEEITDITLTEEERTLFEQRENEQEQWRRKIPHYNFHGLFLYSLAKALHQDSTFMEYLEAKELALELSPALLAQGMLTNMNDHQLESWENQLILISEIYYYDLLWNFELKNKVDGF